MTDDTQASDGPIEDLRQDDALIGALAALDPTTADRPPVPGSTRYLSILEVAISRVPELTQADAATGTNEVAGHRRHRRLAASVAAAAIVALAVGIAVVAPGSDPAPASAAKALAKAAETTGEVTAIRVEATYERPGTTNRLVAEVNGTDQRIKAIVTNADGSEERATIVVIDDTIWEDGAKRTAVPEELNAAYAPSSVAVVEAILDGSTLEDLGDEDVRGQSARHIRATLTPASRSALSALSPSQVAMFELEYPEAVNTLDVWIADDLIRRIVVTIEADGGNNGEPSTNVATVEFYDFGADISISAPT